MMKNKVLLAQKCGSIIILSKDPLTKQWISREHKTQLPNLNFMFGDSNFDVIGLGSKECMKFWDMNKETESELRIDKSEDFKIRNAELSYPFVFIIFEGYILGLIQIYNLVTKELIRTVDKMYCRDIQIDGNFVSITN